MIRRIFLSLLLLTLSLPLIANNLELNPNHPDRYVVQKGDTLWDISGKFLKHPWHWPDIWYANPQVENPHLIYPGDELTLVWRDGRPVLELSRGLPAYRMSPQIRDITPEAAIPAIPLSLIGPFLSKPRVVGEELLEQAPYVVATADERIITGAGDTIYARGTDAYDSEVFSIFRPGDAYKDPDTGELLGYEAIYTGEGAVTRGGDPSTLRLINTTREVMVGDRLLEADEDSFDLTFFPRRPQQDIDGSIISVVDGVSQIGQYQIVVLNRGAREGLETGHVFSVYKRGETIRDTVTQERNAMVTLPEEHAGIAMVFRVFDKVSYAIVMKASTAINIHDKIRSVDL
ncbi:MAG: LysM peptidoglycan-binding domain-containing protein [Methylophaga sp.]|nr:LysM peptidoglycan-binding domain-containing protein [Methylophaga sp.]